MERHWPRNVRVWRRAGRRASARRRAVSPDGPGVSQRPRTPGILREMCANGSGSRSSELVEDPRQVGPTLLALVRAGEFGVVGQILAVDQPASSAMTRDQLGWRPVQPGLIDDLDKGHYFGWPPGVFVACAAADLRPRRQSPKVRVPAPSGRRHFIEWSVRRRMIWARSRTATGSLEAAWPRETK
jgi:hypothetical protein